MTSRGAKIGRYLPIKGLVHLTRRALHKFVTRPHRLDLYRRRTDPFVFRNREGLTFHLEANEEIDRNIAVEGIYDGAFLAFLRAILPPGAVALDIGANIGNHALYLGKTCSSVHCFEPNPRALDRLRRNVEANPACNIVVHPYGLGDYDAIENFHENVSGNLGASHFAQGVEPEDGYRVVNLEIRQADIAIGKLGLPRIDFIKIDVEGMEERLLRAMQDTIACHRPLISFEHHENSLSKEIFPRILSELPVYIVAEPRYAPIEVSKAGKVLWYLRHAGSPALVEVRIPESRSYANLLAIPSEHELSSRVLR
jgi:FkbM family methyltransferase